MLVKKADKLLVAVTAVAGMALISYCVLLFVPLYRTKEIVLSPRVKVVEKHRIRFRPTIVGTDLLLEKQMLLHDGKTVWSCYRSSFGRNFIVSPDGKFVSFDDWLYSNRSTVLNLETGQTRLITPPQ